jgi:hypothetical protein
MPNHCTNLLSCEGAKPIGSIILPYLTNDKKCIDFEKIIPVPYSIKHLDNLNGIDGDWEAPEGEKLPDWFKEQAKALYETLAQHNEKTYGHRSSYDFHVSKWDTKWNAYSCWTLEDDSFNDIQDLTDIGFQTAWSPPLAFLKELAIKTGETLRMSYYDEGWAFGGVCFATPSGTLLDECYDDIKDCPEHLKEELDVQNFLDCMEENEEDEDDE